MGNVAYIFECVMSLLYLIASYILLFTKLLEGWFFNNSSLRMALGILLAMYGFFRVYRAIRKFLEKN